MCSDLLLLENMAFYKQLTLGLADYLENNPNISDVKIEERVPCDPFAINSWENQEKVLLPDDIRNFYSSTDGFSMVWNYIIGDESLPVGKLSVPRLEQLQADEAGDEVSDYKSYKLDSIKENTTISILLPKATTEPSSGETNIFYRSVTGTTQLADSFDAYFRLMLVYHGLPEWQTFHVGEDVSYWSDLLVINFAPHISRNAVEQRLKETSQPLWERGRTAQDMEYLTREFPVNNVDPGLFKIRRTRLQDMS